MDLKRVKSNQPSRDVVYGYIKQAQSLLSNKSAYFNIVDFIRKLILFYYYIPFQQHMEYVDALELQVSDQIDHRDSYGRFCGAEIVEKHEIRLKIHYMAWDAKWDIYANPTTQIHRFAKFGSISKRPALNHRFAGKPLKTGDCININPSKYPGFKCGILNRFDNVSGQVYVRFDCYESNDVETYFWSHLDNEQEILPMFPFENAKRYYTDAITTDNTNATHRYNYAVFLFRSKLYRLALDEFSETFKLNSNNAKPMIQCAHCYEELNNLDNAKKYFLKAIEIDNGKSGQYFYSYALFLQRNKDLSGAVENFKKTIEIEPRPVDAVYNLAVLLRDDIKDYEEAEKYYLKLLGMAKNAHKGSYGYLLYLMGQYEKAIQYISSGMKENPTNRWTHFYYGLVNNALGNDGEANSKLVSVAEMIKSKITEEQLIKFINILNKKKHHDDPAHVVYCEKLIQLIEKQKVECEDEITAESQSDCNGVSKIFNDSDKEISGDANVVVNISDNIVIDNDKDKFVEDLQIDLMVNNDKQEMENNND